MLERDGGERGKSRSHDFKQAKKNIITHKQKSKLNSDCIIKFVSINISKQDVTRIYLDKVTSEPHSG
jgi:hypothetical protein